MRRLFLFRCKLNSHTNTIPAERVTWLAITANQGELVDYSILSIAWLAPQIHSVGRLEFFLKLVVDFEYPRLLSPLASRMPTTIPWVLKNFTYTTISHNIFTIFSLWIMIDPLCITFYIILFWIKMLYS